MIQRYAVNGGVYPADNGILVYTADHLADQVAVAKAWGEKLAELEADHLAVLAVKEEELFAARQAILAGGIREGELMEQIEEQSNILNPGEYISEHERNGVTILVLRKDLWDIFSKRESAEKEEDWQLKYDLLIADYEQKWGLSMRQDEQIAALTEKLEFYRKNRTVQRLDALTAENKWLGERLSVAEDVVSHLVIWGAAPTDALVALVEKAMTLRMRDKETLCIPSAVKKALRGEEEEGK